MLPAGESDRARSRCAGFTILEVVIVVGIIGILSALLIPAVQSSRETALRARCASNLKQILMAFHQHAELHGTLPGVTFEKEHWEVRILPYIEQTKPLIGKNGKLINGPGPIALYACPSDPYSHGTFGAGDHSYFCNNGLGDGRSNGLYTLDGSAPVRIADVTDGLSTTAAVSERLGFPDGLQFASVSYDAPLYRRRMIRQTGAIVGDINDFLDECEHRSLPPNVTYLSIPNYNHVQTPNRNSCINGPFASADASPGPTIVSLASGHAGGVNVAFGDGAVHFISDAIDSTVWRALGTRNGSESVGSGAFAK